MISNYIYFWGVDEENGIFCNWYKSPFTKDGINFLNNEQYFMFKKQQLFDPNNKELENKII